MGRLISYSVDLHMHSSFSDGLHTPAELVSKARKLRLETIALCDHDTVAGLKAMEDAIGEDAGENPVRLIRCVELSCGAEANIHLLGYHVDAENRLLLSEMEAARNRRLARMEKMIGRLEGLGIVFTQEARARLLIPGTGRAHLARELIAAGVVNTMQQVFDRYLDVGRPGYEPMEKLSAVEGVRLLRHAGALPVLAHPMRLRMTEEARLALMEELAANGLMGIEAWHPSSTGRQGVQLESWARRRNLLVTGGSDYHGEANSSISMGRMPPGWRNWREDTEKLIQLRDQQ
ncbi:MAG: PHP domain-containing protein [Clostridiales bacterium]|nr:PHP domain-containing protein [Clostridiales bacterium]